MNSFERVTIRGQQIEETRYGRMASGAQYARMRIKIEHTGRRNRGHIYYTIFAHGSDLPAVHAHSGIGAWVYCQGAMIYDRNTGGPYLLTKADDEVPQANFDINARRLEFVTEQTIGDLE